MEHKLGDFVLRHEAAVRRVVAVAKGVVYTTNLAGGRVSNSPSDLELLWRPKFRAEAVVWSIRAKRFGRVLRAELRNEEHYYVVEHGEHISDYEEKDLEPYTGQDKEKSMRIKPDRYALYVVKKGERTPACMIMQLSFNQLIELDALGGDILVVDSIFGLKTEAIVEDFQDQLGTKPDSLVGKNTWAAIIDKLPEAWRPPLRLRMMTWMDTYENGSRRKGFSGYNIIPKEGWYNFGVYNANKGSAKTILRMGGAGHLAGVIETQPMDVADWFGSKEGRKAQLDYTDKYIIPPSIRNLERVGLNLPISSEESLPDTFNDPWMERLFVLSCDITVNSGAGGFRPKKSPRQWDGGQYPWPADRLPDKEACKAIFSEEFGQRISSDYKYVKSDSRDTYGNALKRCLDELCTTNEMKIELVGELQARCVISTWRDLIIQRRRSIARAEGHFFQGGKPNRLYFGVC